jgi:hypothetical protein
MNKPFRSKFFAEGIAGEAGGSPAQYPLLYWRSGIPSGRGTGDDS